MAFKIIGKIRRGIRMLKYITQNKEPSGLRIRSKANGSIISESFQCFINLKFVSDVLAIIYIVYTKLIISISVMCSNI